MSQTTDVSASWRWVLSAAKQTVLLLGVFLVGQNSLVAQLGEVAQLGCDSGNDGSGFALRRLFDSGRCRAVTGGGLFFGSRRGACASWRRAAGTGADRSG